MNSSPDRQLRQVAAETWFGAGAIGSGISPDVAEDLGYTAPERLQEVMDHSREIGALAAKQDTVEVDQRVGMFGKSTDPDQNARNADQLRKISQKHFKRSS